MAERNPAYAMNSHSGTDDGLLPRRSWAAAPAPKVDTDDVGNEANPVTIVEGTAFDVRKLAYAAGCKITSSDFGMELENLKLTNKPRRSR
ncbi:MAG: hypothetical protein ABIW49_08510 [Knoellia sp.]